MTYDLPARLAAKLVTGDVDKDRKAVARVLETSIGLNRELLTISYSDPTELKKVLKALDIELLERADGEVV